MRVQRALRTKDLENRRLEKCNFNMGIFSGSCESNQPSPSLMDDCPENIEI